MKKRILSLAVALAVLCSLTIFASAEEPDPNITVQLDGQDLEFTDAVPQVKNFRTFLPCRAVFEAMGAKVSAQGDVITAVRGDTTLTMTIGETTAEIVRNGETDTLYMDVAPYVDNTSWRTYVPVRFAADAFGCNVGWDAEAQTVIIVDVDRLVDEALAGKHFTLLEQLVEYSQKYNEGNWAADGTMHAGVTVLGSEEFSILDGTVSALTSGQSAVEMNMAMELDLNGLLSHIAYLSGSALDMPQDDLHLNVTMDMKADMNTGVFYMKLDDESCRQIDLEPGTWLALDMKTLMDQAGMEWDHEAMLDMLSEVDMIDTLETVLAQLPLTEADSSYAALSGTLDLAFAALSDEGFRKTDSGYATTLTLAPEGMELTFDIALTTDASGKVNGYHMDVAIHAPLENMAPASEIAFAMSTGIDPNDHMTAEIELSLHPLFNANIAMEMDYTVTDKVPDTALPQGAATVDYWSLVNGSVSP